MDKGDFSENQMAAFSREGLSSQAIRQVKLAKYQQKKIDTS